MAESETLTGHEFLKQQAINAIVFLEKRQERRKFKKKPLIIGACLRSGTTLLLSILGAHPNIFALPIQTFAFDLWKEAKNKTSGNDLELAKPERLYGYFLINRIPSSAKRWCEKTPKNIQSFDKILNYFGNDVQLINMFREGRNIITSKHPKHSPDKYRVSVERWVQDETLGLQFESHPQVLNIRYEDLINQFESEIKKIYNFLQEPVPEDPLTWIQNTNKKQSKPWAVRCRNYTVVQ